MQVGKRLTVAYQLYILQTSYKCVNEAAICFDRLVITVGFVVKTATVRSSGSSTSRQKNTKTGFSTLRMIKTAGSIDFPQALLKFVKGKIRSYINKYRFCLLT